MFNHGKNISNYGKMEMFHHLCIERVDGGVTKVFPEFPRPVRILPFTVISCQSQLKGYEYRGSACVFDEKEVIRQEENSCWVIPAGVRHRFLKLDEGHLSVWVHINFSWVPNWNIFDFYQVPHCLEKSIQKRVCSLVRILAEKRNGTLAEICRMKRAEFELLEIILERSSARFGLSCFRTSYLDFLPLLEFIQTHLSESPGLDRLAKEYGMSRSSLEKRFRNAFGISLGHFLMNNRLAEAAKLLRDHTLSCAEVADAVGFSNSFVFSRAFRKAYQLSPREYRRIRGE